MIIIITNQTLEKYKTELKKHFSFKVWGVSVHIFYGGWAVTSFLGCAALAKAFKIWGRPGDHPKQKQHTVTTLIQ